MTGFGESVKKGLATHEQAAQARKEMDQLLTAASKDITEVLQLDIVLQFEPRDQPARPQTLQELTLGIPAPREKIVALIARGPKGSKVLAEVKFGELGYPVTLRWEDEFRMVPDRTAFEAVLQDLLAHGSTGAKFIALATKP